MAAATFNEEKETSTAELFPCATCKRTFLPKSLPTHERVCALQASRKRQKFSSLKQRVEGTELQQHKSTSVPAKQTETQNNWKQKHEDFVSTIRQARSGNIMTSKRLTSTKGAKERCPTCDRQFGPSAFDRHVEWCKQQKKYAIKLPANVLLAKERLEARIKYRVPMTNSTKKTNLDRKYDDPSKNETKTLVSVQSTKCSEQKSNIRKPQEGVMKPNQLKTLKKNTSSVSEGKIARKSARTRRKLQSPKIRVPKNITGISLSDFITQRATQKFASKNVQGAPPSTKNNKIKSADADNSAKSLAKQKMATIQLMLTDQNLHSQLQNHDSTFVAQTVARGVTNDANVRFILDEKAEQAKSSDKTEKRMATLESCPMNYPFNTFEASGKVFILQEVSHLYKFCGTHSAQDVTDKSSGVIDSSQKNKSQEYSINSEADEKGLNSTKLKSDITEMFYRSVQNKFPSTALSLHDWCNNTDSLTFHCKKKTSNMSLHTSDLELYKPAPSKVDEQFSKRCTTENTEREVTCTSNDNKLNEGNVNLTSEIKSENLGSDIKLSEKKGNDEKFKEERKVAVEIIATEPNEPENSPSVPYVNLYRSNSSEIIIEQDCLEVLNKLFNQREDRSCNVIFVREGKSTDKEHPHNIRHYKQEQLKYEKIKTILRHIKASSKGLKIEPGEKFKFTELIYDKFEKLRPRRNKSFFKCPKKTRFISNLYAPRRKMCTIKIRKSDTMRMASRSSTSRRHAANTTEGINGEAANPFPSAKNPDNYNSNDHGKVIFTRKYCRTKSAVKRDIFWDKFLQLTGSVTQNEEQTHCCIEEETLSSSVCATLKNPDIPNELLPSNGNLDNNRHSPKTQPAKHILKIQVQREPPTDCIPNSNGSGASTTQNACTFTKYCHDCGSKYPVNTVKFCGQCGVKRLTL